MNFSLLGNYIFLLLGVSGNLLSAAENDKGNIRTLNFKNSASEIVKDLVSNWNSPLTYLRNRGYLQTPVMNLGDEFKQNVYRSARSYETDVGADLNDLFRTLFSTSNNTVVSDEIKSKMGVPWDMVDIKNSVRDNANKFYEHFYNKHTAEKNPIQNVEVGDTDLDKKVAQLYPSVMPSESAQEQKTGDPKKMIISPFVSKKPNYMNGLAKILTNRQLPGKTMAFTGQEPRRGSSKLD